MLKGPTYADALDALMTGLPTDADSQRPATRSFHELSWPDLSRMCQTQESAIGFSLLLSAPQPIGELAARTGLPASAVVTALTETARHHPEFGECVVLRSLQEETEVRMHDLKKHDRVVWDEVDIAEGCRPAFVVKVMNLLRPSRPAALRAD
jgi:hypothetical protein